MNRIDLYTAFISEQVRDPLKTLSKFTSRHAKDVPGKEEDYNKAGEVITTPVMTKQIPLKGYDENKAENMWTALDKSGIRPNDKNLPIKNFKVRNLTPSQEHLRVDNASLKQKIISGTIDNVKGTSSPINVVTHKGIHYIVDGHHRALAARLRGDEEISARHINLDQ